MRGLGRLLTGTGSGSGYSLLSAGSVVIAVLTYVRQAFIADIFGMTWQTDAYAVAMVFPILVRQIIAHSFNSTFIPVYSQVMVDEGRQGADRLLSRTLTWIFLLGGAAAGALLLLGMDIVRIAGPGLGGRGLSLSASMLRILVPIMVVNSANGVLDSLLVYRSRYALVAALRVGSVAVSLLLVPLAHQALGIHVLPVSVVAGPLTVFPVALWMVIRDGSSPRPKVDPRDRSFRTLVRMALPVTVGAAAGFAGPIFDKMLASLLQASSVTALEYANRIKMMAHGILLAPLITLADVNLSKRAARRSIPELKENLLAFTRWSSFISIPVAVLMTALATPMVVALFRRGSFGVREASLVGYGLAFYAPWLAQVGMGSVVSRGFYAMKDSFTPVVIGIWAMACNILLNFILVGPLGIGGLALATTLSSSAKTAFLFFSFRLKVGPLGAAGTVREHLRLLLGAAAMIGLILLLEEVWPTDLHGGLYAVLLRVGLVAIASLAVYLIVARLAGSRQLTSLRERVRRALLR